MFFYFLIIFFLPLRILQESPPGICLCVSCGARRGTFVINSTPDIVALLFIDLRILIKMIMMSMRMMMILVTKMVIVRMRFRVVTMMVMENKTSENVPFYSRIETLLLPGLCVT